MDHVVTILMEQINTKDTGIQNEQNMILKLKKKKKCRIYTIQIET